MYHIFDIKPGITKFMYDEDHGAEIELKIVPTEILGACFVIQAKSVQGLNKAYGNVYVGYNKNLDNLDVPKRFKIFLNLNITK